MKTIFFNMLLFLILLITAGTPTLANPLSQENNENKSGSSIYVLSQRKMDVTGDRRPDVVTLMGQKEKQENIYSENLFLILQDSATHRFTTLNLNDGGYHPHIQFFDFNGDHIPETYISAETGGRGGTSVFHLVSAKNNHVFEIPVPSSLGISGRFTDGYNATILVKNTGKITSINLKERKQKYDTSEVYKNGTLVKPIKVSANKFSMLTPVDINGDGIFELRGVQRISGIANADSVAFADSVWKFQYTRWELVSSSVHKAN
ncbi:hypothetical protein M1K46_14540 [Fictibacillus sp. WQ 8-8]|uniref:hypothetical protein n=1 Tax=unclassified Fictibacillus TaxID=2644029 RepID=UPI0006A792DA|nr:MULTISPECIES: hypothetical protein [unclassified Fictibacillus]MCQ6266870.1 hypothetical protein [Fictibacillus sp. WQ 8-8]UZJ78036.1 hypothetical protein OKX00_18065 [Fictibacillus sp. KU28468]